MSIHDTNIVRQVSSVRAESKNHTHIHMRELHHGVKVHLKSLEEVFATYDTEPKQGLDSEAAKRKLKEGLNKLTPPPTNYIRKFIVYVFGGFNSLMWLAALLSFLSYEPLGAPNPAPLSLGVGVLLIIVVSVSTFFYAYVDYNASKIMKSIRSLVAEEAIVVRDGKEERIDAKQVVPGDIVILSIGQRVPADVRLVEVSADLKFDRALLTGESELVPGTVEATDDNPLETRNLALSSTFVAQGRARGVVFKTGDGTFIGQILKMSGKQKTTMTPIQKGINRFTIIISVLAIAFFCLAMLLWGVWIRVDHPAYETAAVAIINAMGCLTAFVPTGLPVCFALSLTIIARRMAARKVLVKNLTSIETLGCMSVLCSDKTGTLTMGKMFVQESTFIDKNIPTSEALGDQVKEVPALRDLYMISSICNDAVFLAGKGNDALPIAERPVSGDSTDAAILRYSESLRTFYPKIEGLGVLFSMAFNSKNKYMAKLIKVRNEAPELFIKGAPDILIQYCTRALQSNGSLVDLTPENLAKIIKLQEEASSQGLRVLALCQKPFKDTAEMPLGHQDEMEKYVSSQISGLTLVGLLSIRDPPRPDTHDTIKTIRGAGVRVFMVTGDAELTALAIAKQVGIVTAPNPYRFANLKGLKEQNREGKRRLSQMKPKLGDPIQAISITGRELTMMTQDDWDYCATHFTEMVFARTTPEQKVLIVESVKKRGDNIVAVTGDGTNDAPALKAADIGVAMGSGTDVAREAASMILLNNDFSSIVVGIENGRLVFENIKKVLMYLMPAGSYAEFMPVVMNVFFGMQLAMSSFQQVVFCVFNDVAMSTSLMYEKAESDLMKRPPRNPRINKLTDLKFFAQIYLFFGVGIWISGFAMWFLYMKQQGLGFYDLMLVFDNWADGWAGHSIADLTNFVNTGECVYYVTLVIMQFGTILAVRNRHVSFLESNPLWGPRQNLVIPFSMIGTVLITIVVLYGPALQSVFGTTSIPVEYWFIPFGLGFGNFLLDEFRKWIVRRFPESVIAKVAWKSSLEEKLSLEEFLTNSNHLRFLLSQWRLDWFMSAGDANIIVPIDKLSTNTKIHFQALEEVYATYGTHPQQGLDSEAARRKSKDGQNKLTPPPSGWLRKLVINIFGGFNALMWLAALLSFISYEPLGAPNPAPLSIGVGVLLIIVIAVSTFFYAYVDWNASKIMKSIRSIVADNAIVIRDGKEERIEAKNVVVGDVIVLSIGQRVPADLRLVEVSVDLKFDRALLTGESELVPGTIEPTDEDPLQTRNLALSSTFVAQGKAKGVVYQIGDNTTIGRIVKMSGKQKTTMTPIQKGINRFTIIISVVAISFFSIAMIVWGAWIRTSYPGYETAAVAIINAMGCLTAFVPQGLPVCFALSLTIIARRMAARKVLVKNLTSIETLGCMSVLCSDKTGTLTMGKMSVQEAIFIDKNLPTSEALGDQAKEVPALRDLYMISSICNDAVFLAGKGNDALPIAERPVSGDSTDAAILRYSESLRTLYPKLEGYGVLFSMAFNSKNKYMAKLIQAGPDHPKLYIKGAPEILIQSCTKALQANGSLVDLTPENLAKVNKIQEETSSQGLRVLALCQKLFNEAPNLPLGNQEEMEKYVSSQINGLTLVGLLCIRDPPRPDTLDTVQKMRGAGIRVFMVTGDAELTALSIARQVGIITAASPFHFANLKGLKEPAKLKLKSSQMKPRLGDPIKAISVTGKDLHMMTEEDWDFCASNFAEMVFARTTPEQKVLIVENMKKRGDNIVAVTGDGTNDAPALKAADIGVAMGSGTDVAREAASMILLDNDFSSMLIGIENGRLVFENIKKVILYLMPAGTYAEFMTVLMNVFFGMQLALSSFQQVLFSVSNDIVMSISLMYEKAESDLMKRPPRNPRIDKLADWKFFVQIYCIIGVGIWLSGFGMWFLYLSEQGLGFYDLVLVYDKWQDGWAGQSIAALTNDVNTGECIYYVTLAIMQFGTLLAIRNRHVSILESNPLWGPRQNLVIPVSMCATMLICVACLYGPALENVFGTAVIPVKFWFIPFALAFGNLLIDEFRKLIVRRFPKSFLAKIAW